MKILIATNSYPTQKNPTHQLFIKNIYEGLREEGFEVDLVYNPYFDYFKCDLKEGSIFSSFFKSVFLFFACLPVILYRARKYDLLYSHAPVWPGFFMLAAQKIHNVNHVTYVHGSVNHYVHRRGLLYRLAFFTLQKSTHVVTNSEYMVQRLESEYNCKSRVITPGFNQYVFSYQPGHRKIDILFAGSTIRRKGIRLLLDTIGRFKGFYSEKSLIIKMHFSGGLKDELIKYAGSLGIDDLIEFGDKLRENELSEAYKDTKVFVFPSTEEPLGLVGIEAIACGALLVGSDSGGIKEYLIDEKNGYLFEDGDPNDLQKKIEKALNQFPEFQKKQPAVSKTVENFSLSEAMKQTVSFFSELSN